MTTNTSLPRILFDPEVYTSMLDEIIFRSGVQNITLQTIIFLNSIYMNEFLDEDVEWVDRSDDEYKKYTNDRIQSFISVGVELIKIDNLIQNEDRPTSTVGYGEVNKRQSLPHSNETNHTNKSHSTNKSYSTKLAPVPEYVGEYGMLDTIEEDENDEFYQKVKKLNVQQKEDKTVKFQTLS